MQTNKPFKTLTLLLSALLLVGCIEEPQQPATPTQPTTTQTEQPKQQEPIEVTPTKEEKEIKLSTNPLDSLPHLYEQTKDIPAFNGNAFTTLNNNEPFFLDEPYDFDAIFSDSLEYYAPLDNLSRPQMAFSFVSIDTMPTKKRESIGSIKPAGWHTTKYDSIKTKYLYNRCHLLGYQLTAENANPLNLITGTRYLNVEGMLPMENLVADYIKETNNVVLYRVTPIYEDNNLIAKGVIMEGMSIELNEEGNEYGNDILFNIFAYNVQPGIEIDYLTGDSFETNPPQQTKEVSQVDPYEQEKLDCKNKNGQWYNNTCHIIDPYKQAKTDCANNYGTWDANKNECTWPEAQQPAYQETYQEPTYQQPSNGVQKGYVLNTNTMKIHTHGCRHVKEIYAENRMDVTANFQDLLDQGYSPCGRCHPN